MTSLPLNRSSFLFIYFVRVFICFVAVFWQIVFYCCQTESESVCRPQSQRDQRSSEILWHGTRPERRARTELPSQITFNDNGSFRMRGFVPQTTGKGKKGVAGNNYRCNYSWDPDKVQVRSRQRVSSSFCSLNVAVRKSKGIPVFSVFLYRSVSGSLFVTSKAICKQEITSCLVLNIFKLF